MQLLKLFRINIHLESKNETNTISFDSCTIHSEPCLRRI